MVFFGFSPGLSSIWISTFSAVKSLIDLIAIDFFLAAASTEAINESVVVPNGTERIASVRSPVISMRARKRMRPRPWSYSEASIRPP